MATSLLKFSLKTNLVKSVISEIVSNVSRYYYTFGHTGTWNNDNTPESVSDSFEYENETRNEILLYKQIDANDICAVIPRIDWVAGYTFDMYDEYSADNPAFSGATALESAEFYCLTDDFNVYKCLYNNDNKPSSLRPEGTSTTPIILGDGYIWKYMYTIPLSVRNKFLTATTMPVVTALSNQFYSKGSIVSYTIENPGKKYPRASYKIVGLKVMDAGSGYTSAPTVTIAGPTSTGGTGTTATVALVTINSGIVTSASIDVQGSGYLYQPNITVTGGGSGVTRQAVFEPVLERISNVFTTLKVTGDGYLEENPYQVQSIEITSGGSGYASATLFFKDPDLLNGVKAEATAIVSDVTVGSVTSHSATTVNGNAATNIIGTFSQTIAVDTYVKLGTSNTVYKVLSTTSQNNILTSITVNAVVTPLANAVIKVAGRITGFTVNNPGYGYSKPFFSNFQNPNASNIVLVNATSISTITAAGLSFNVITKKNEAELLPIINTNGEIQEIQISKPGLGYTYALVTVETSLDPEDDPEFEEASILLNFGIGDIESRQSTVELTAIPGAIHVIKVDNPGFGYTAPPSITVTGDGVGCTAVATLTLTGSIDKIQVTSIGSGYTRASVTITGTSSTAAQARAIISPKGGHGKDAIGELYSKTIVFHGNLSKEKNQGFVSTNDYRQVCIVKNPKIFAKENNLRLALASSCFVAIGTSGQAGLNSINNDDILTWTDTANNRVYSFRVVEKNINYSATQSALLLAYLDNNIPAAGATFSKVGAAFSTTDLVLPNVNKFSGDLLTIDNRLKFSPSTQQIVVVTNSITF